MLLSSLKGLGGRAHIAVCHHEQRRFDMEWHRDCMRFALRSEWNRLAIWLESRHDLARIVMQFDPNCKAKRHKSHCSKTANKGKNHYISPSISIHCNNHKVRIYAFLDIFSNVQKHLFEKGLTGEKRSFLPDFFLFRTTSHDIRLLPPAVFGEIPIFWKIARCKVFLPFHTPSPTPSSRHRKKTKKWRLRILMPAKRNNLECFYIKNYKSGDNIWRYANNLILLHRNQA